jgi:hypothetical protein
VNTAIAFGVISIIITATYIIIMLARIPSLCTTIHHGVHNSFTRMMIWIFAIPLMILYVNDVISMMVFYWGTPAFKMTAQSYNVHDGDFESYNNDDGC